MTTANPVDVHIGAMIRARRKELRISQETLASSLGITFQAVQAYEKADNRVLASRLAEIAKILDVPVTYFFEDTDDKKKG